MNDSSVTPEHAWKRAWLSAPAPAEDAVFFSVVAALTRIAVVIWGAPRFPPAEDGHYYHVVATRIADGFGYTWLWPDGAVTYEGQATAGTWRLYVVNGKRVIRAEAKNKTTGAVTWAELTEAK